SPPIKDEQHEPYRRFDTADNNPIFPARKLILTKAGREGPCDLPTGRGMTEPSPRFQRRCRRLRIVGWVGVLGIVGRRSERNVALRFRSAARTAVSQYRGKWVRATRKVKWRVQPQCLPWCALRLENR